MTICSSEKKAASRNATLERRRVKSHRRTSRRGCPLLDAIHLQSRSELIAVFVGTAEHKLLVLFLLDDLIGTRRALVARTVKINHVTGGVTFQLWIVARQSPLPHRGKFHVTIALGGLFLQQRLVASECAARQGPNQKNYRCRCSYPFHNFSSF